MTGRRPGTRLIRQGGAFALVALATACGAGGELERGLGDVQRAAGAFPYRCADGSSLLAEFDDAAGTAMLTLNNQRVTLDQARSGSGARYTSPEGYEFWIKGEEALFRQPGGEETQCRTT